MTVPTVIKAHPKRADMVMNLKRNYFPYSRVSMDHGLGIHENSLRALTMLYEYCEEEGKEVGFKIEDDLVPCKSFSENIGEIVDNMPEDCGALTVFSNKKEDKEFMESEGGGFDKRTNEICIPAGFYRVEILCQIIEGIQSYIDEGEEEENEWDSVVRSVLKSHDHYSKYVFVPSMVQHVGKESLHGHGWNVGGVERESRTFPGMDADVLKYID